MSGVSVVIPLYNSSIFIRETLKSIWDQTRLPDEIILVDDCSTDDTVTLCESMASESPVPIRIIQLQVNSGGPVVPMNTGISCARSEFIIQLDHDDLFSQDRIETCLSIITKYPEASFVFGDYVMMETGVESFENSNAFNNTKLRQFIAKAEHGIAVLQRREWIEDFFKHPLGCSCSNHFFRKSLWKRIGGYKAYAAGCADYAFVLEGFGEMVVWTDKIAFKKRVHSRNFWKTTPENRSLILDVRYRFLKNSHGQEKRSLQKCYSDMLKREIQWCRWNGFYADANELGRKAVLSGFVSLGVFELLKNMISAVRNFRS